MSPEGSERSGKKHRRVISVNNAKPPLLLHEAAMLQLGLPLKRIKEWQTADCTMAAGGQSAFVEYPRWWDDYKVICTAVINGKDVTRTMPLVNFVFENTFHNAKHSVGRLPTVYLDVFSLEDIDVGKFTGLQVMQKAPVVQPVTARIP